MIIGIPKEIKPEEKNTIDDTGRKETWKNY
jgi:hypothetical protein